MNRTCNEQNLKELDAWCRQTLIVSPPERKFSEANYNSYLKKVQLNFFPFLKYSKSMFDKKSSKFDDANYQQQLKYISDHSIPDLDTFRRILFRNGIGYQLNEDGKLYVKRFYRIPALLWPTQEKTDYMNLVENSEFSIPLTNEKSAFEGNESTMDKIFDENFEKVGDDDANLHAEIWKLSSNVTDNIDEKGDPSTLLGFFNKKGNERHDLNSNLGGGNADFDMDIAAGKKKINNHLQFFGHNREEKFLNIVGEFSERPRTMLQLERELWFRRMEYFSIEDAIDESDALSISGSRVDQQLMIRAELSMKYEEKEASRRRAEWSSRLLPWEKHTKKELLEGKNRKGKTEDHFDMKLSLPTWNKDN